MCAQGGYADTDVAVIEASHDTLGEYRLLLRRRATDLLFTENETQRQRLWGVPNRTPIRQGRVSRFRRHGQTGAVNPARTGTKAAAHYRSTIDSRRNA